MLSLKLNEQTEVVTKVCDVAGKEFSIEQVDLTNLVLQFCVFGVVLQCCSVVL